MLTPAASTNGPSTDSHSPPPRLSVASSTEFVAAAVHEIATPSATDLAVKPGRLNRGRELCGERGRCNRGVDVQYYGTRIDGAERGIFQPVQREEGAFISIRGDDTTCVQETWCPIHFVALRRCEGIEPESKLDEKQPRSCAVGDLRSEYKRDIHCGRLLGSSSVRLHGSSRQLRRMWLTDLFYRYNGNPDWYRRRVTRKNERLKWLVDRGRRSAIPDQKRFQTGWDRRFKIDVNNRSDR